MAGVLWLSGRTPAFGLWVPIGLAVIACGWFWNLRKRRHFILVSRKTIRILGRKTSPEVYAMSEVAGIKWDFVTGEIILERSDGSQLVTINRRFLASNIRARRMVKTVESYLRLAGQLGNSGSCRI